MKTKKLSAADEVKVRLAGVITEAQAINHWNMVQLAAKLEMCDKTLRLRMENPYTWKMMELCRLALYAHRPLSDVMAIISGLSWVNKGI